MESSSGTLTLLENKLIVAFHLFEVISLALENKDEETAKRLIAELAVYLVLIDKKCVAKEL